MNDWIAWVHVSIVAPWAKDASVSTAGHKSINSPAFHNPADMADWIAANAPVVVGSAPFSVINDNVPGGRNFYYLSGIDGAGNYVDAYVNSHNNP